MNREIKFRAWDKTYKRMNYKVQVGNTDYADQNYTCNSIWVDYGDRGSVGWMNADDKCIDLMQYTGLKDMNGKEIYEGDILKWRCSKSFFKKEDFYTVTIEWTKNAHGYSLTIHHKGEKWATQKIYWNACEREIIGNIYENPELIAQ